MKIARKLALTTAVAVVSLGAVGLASPASAVDSAWGCGGFCAVVPTSR